MRTVKENLLPSYTHGLHFIVDTNTSPIRKMMPKGIKIETAKLSSLLNVSTHTLTDYLQKRKVEGECTVVFLQLDTKTTDPVRTLRSLIPDLLEKAADSICYGVDNSNMVLVIKHQWLPSDVYFLEN